MAFEDDFEELDTMLLAKSTDYERMRSLLQAIRQFREIARMSGAAQDNLYAFIANGHRKALVQLESGDTASAKKEMAWALSWFLLRFHGVDPDSISQHPRIAEELRAARELAERSQVLKEALSQRHDIHAI